MSVTFYKVINNSIDKQLVFSIIWKIEVLADRTQNEDVWSHDFIGSMTGKLFTRVDKLTGHAKETSKNSCKLSSKNIF